MNPIIVKCPKCREVLEIETKRGKIIKHHPEVKPKAGGDFLKERINSLEEEKAKREALVADSRAREESRQERYEELFKKVKEQAKEGPSSDRPLREIDID